MIKVENLSLKVKDRVILTDINFEVSDNQIVGLLGHNAAGKSTLQRFIANEEAITEGEIYINGRKNSFGEYNNCVLITDKNFLKGNMSIISNLKNLDVFKELNMVYILEKLKEFGIDENVAYSSLSKGSKQIVHILVALSKKALVYLFDEPLSSIDIFNRKKIADLILDAQDRGATIIITTHLINEFQMLFDKMIYINQGKIEHDMTIEALFEKGYRSIEDFVLKEYGGINNA